METKIAHGRKYKVAQSTQQRGTKVTVHVIMIINHSKDKAAGSHGSEVIAN